MEYCLLIRTLYESLKQTFSGLISIQLRLVFMEISMTTVIIGGDTIKLIDNYRQSGVHIVAFCCRGNMHKNEVELYEK